MLKSIMANKLIQLKDGSDNLFPATSKQTDSKTYTHSSGITVKAQKIGGLCLLSLTGTATFPASWTTLCTLDAKYRPILDAPYQTLANQNNGSVFLLSVAATGVVRVNATGGAISSKYLNCFIMYPIAD